MIEKKVQHTPQALWIRRAKPSYTMIEWAKRASYKYRKGVAVASSSGVNVVMADDRKRIDAGACHQEPTGVASI